MMPPLVWAGQLASALLCFCWRWRLVAWRKILFATSNFENPASISLRNLDTSSVLEDPHGSIDHLLMHGTVL
jgi:hypothetical protein